MELELYSEVSSGIMIRAVASSLAGGGDSETRRLGSVDYAAGARQETNKAARVQREQACVRVRLRQWGPTEWAGTRRVLVLSIVLSETASSQFPDGSRSLCLLISINRGSR